MQIEIGFNEGPRVIAECKSMKYSMEEKWIKIFSEKDHKDFKGIFYFKYFQILKSGNDD
jgi:hypothetical protein